MGQQALVAVRKDRRRVDVLRDADRQLRTLNRVTQDKFMLQMQHDVGRGNRAAVG